MSLWRSGALAALVAALTGCASATDSTREEAAPASYVFVSGACQFDTGDRDVACGTISVPENYASPEGRRIDLNVVWIRALEPQSPRQAIFEFEGGPGFGVTDNAVDYLGDLAPLSRRRDVVLFDMRGTGRSNRLACTAVEAYRSADRNAPLYPPELIAQCREEVAAHADIAQYTTLNAARDADSVRQALGFERIDVSGASYGSTLTLAYIAAFPQHVRSAAIFGAAPALAQPPRAHAPNAQRSLELYFQECAADAACAAAFPDPASDLERVRERLAAPDAPFAFEIFMERMRERLYQPQGARGLPLMLRRAAAGDFANFTTPPPGGGGRALGDGLYLSITCAESFPFFDYEAAAAASRATAFGDYRLRRQRAACAEWPAPPAPTPDPVGPVDIPILIAAGHLDPATPPAWAEAVRAHFPRHHYVLIEDAAHGLFGLENADCLVAIQAAFHEDPDAETLDTSCIATMTRRPFELE